METWRHGDIDMINDTWKHREMGTWRNGDMNIETRAWRHRHEI